MTTRLVTLTAIWLGAVSMARAADLEEGIALYWSGRYADTINVLTLARHDELRVDEQVECLKYLAFSYVAVGDNDSAREVFGELLGSDPRHQLDDALVSPKIIRQFEAARSEVIAATFASGKETYFAKDYAATREAMGRVLALDPEHTLAKEYEQLAVEQEALIEKAQALTESVEPEREQPPEPENIIYRQTGDITPAVVLRKVEPDYPIAARRAGEEGTVVATLVIDASGIVQEARIIRPLSPTLDRAVLDAVRQWRYRPAVKDGRAVAVYSVVRLEFRLDR